MLDWVNLYGGRLGFLGDNRRINVALSRAHASLIIFFSQSPSNDLDRPRRKKQRGNSPPTEVTNHWDWLVQRGYDIIIPPEALGRGDILTETGEEDGADIQQPGAEPAAWMRGSGDQQMTFSETHAEAAGAEEVADTEEAVGAWYSAAVMAGTDSEPAHSQSEPKADDFSW